MKHASLSPADLPTAQLHATLLAGIAPRPIAFVSTIDLDGNINLSPFSFFNIFGSNPPTVIFSPARRVRDNTTKHTLDNLLEVAECTINIVDFSMVEQMSLASTEYDKGVNEFLKAGLTQEQSLLVKPPFVAESPMALECKVQQIIPTGQEGGAGNLVIAQIVHIHLRKDTLNEQGTPDPDLLDLVGRMGGEYYVRASSNALFEIPKPLREKGIGVDALPIAIRHSLILSGNDLGRLGNIARFPSEEELENMRQQNVWQSPPNRSTEDLLAARHQHAKALLAQGQSREALIYLLA